MFEEVSSFAISSRSDVAVIDRALEDFLLASALAHEHRLKMFGTMRKEIVCVWQRF